MLLAWMVNPLRAVKNFLLVQGHRFGLLGLE